MPTIKEIAELAGVSRGTVDRVLNKRGGVNPTTEEKVLEIAKALNYKPNLAGTILAAQKKRLMLGVVLLGVGTPFYDDVLSGVRQKAAELESYNCTVVVKHTEYDAIAQLQAIQELVAEGVNGIAITPYNDNRIRKEIHRLFSLGIPVVTLNTDIENTERLAYVGCNFYHSGETAAGLMHLITSGQVFVGIISGSRDVLCHTQRIAGFSNTIQKKYPNIRVSAAITNQDDDFESYEQTRRLLDSHPEINALYFTAGGVYGGCKAVIASGRHYDIRIITNDAVATTREMIEQGVIAATICQEPEVQGSKPLDLLFNYLTTGELPKEEFNYVDAEIKILENI